MVCVIDVYCGLVDFDVVLVVYGGVVVGVFCGVLV